MIESRVGSGGHYLVLGAVRGLLAEVPRVLARLEAYAPGVVAVGLSPDEAASLREHFVGQAAEPLVPLAPSEEEQFQMIDHLGVLENFDVLTKSDVLSELPPRTQQEQAPAKDDAQPQGDGG